MAKNTSPPLRVAPLQRVVAEPITDPVEQAALDEQRRRVREDGQPLPTQDATAPSALLAVARLVELSRQLSAADRGSLLGRLGAELPPEQQFELLAQVLTGLSPEALCLLEEELAGRLGARSN